MNKPSAPKRRRPANFKAYEDACKRGEVAPGKMFVFDYVGLVEQRSGIGGNRFVWRISMWA